MKLNTKLIESIVVLTCFQCSLVASFSPLSKQVIKLPKLEHKNQVHIATPIARNPYKTETSSSPSRLHASIYDEKVSDMQSTPPDGESTAFTKLKHIGYVVVFTFWWYLFSW